MLQKGFALLTDIGVPSIARLAKNHGDRLVSRLTQRFDGVALTANSTVRTGPESHFVIHLRSFPRGIDATPMS